MGGGGGSSRWTGKDHESLLKDAAKELKKAAGEGKRNVFLSFAFEDVKEVNLLRAHSKNDKSDIEFNDWSVQDPYESDRAAYIKQKIGERISQCSAVVVYVSPNASQSKWVTWEIEEGVRRGKMVICVHKGAKPPAMLPAAVKDHGLRVVKWADLAGELEKK